MAVVPEPLRRFAERSASSMPADPRRALFEQTGEMRLQPDGRWMTFTAEQWASLTDVAFCWHARVKMAPLVTAVVEDAFEDGHGHLDVKIWGGLRVSHGEGPEIDRGEVQRYLAELPFFPSAMLTNEALRFDEGPDGAHRVWVGDPECYVDLHLDEDGDVVRAYTETRPRLGEGPTPWEGRFFDYAVLDGVRLPTRAEVAWTLDGEPFVYWRGRIASYGWQT
ncbi:MAG: hypothetical protein H6719_33635 [Sandaracinaceae bacterium]|nr:hypothetical protein [Sandaracinaceae bacterium]